MKLYNTIFILFIIIMFLTIFVIITNTHHISIKQYSCNQIRDGLLDCLTSERLFNISLMCFDPEKVYIYYKIKCLNEGLEDGT